MTRWQEPALYGGFIHPWSSRNADDLHLMVSKWTRTPDGRSTAYHVSQFVGSLEPPEAAGRRRVPLSARRHSTRDRAGVVGQEAPSGAARDRSAGRRRICSTARS